jgi:hypothetical protein
MMKEPTSPTVNSSWASPGWLGTSNLPPFECKVYKTVPIRWCIRSHTRSIKGSLVRQGGVALDVHDGVGALSQHTRWGEMTSACTPTPSVAMTIPVVTAECRACMQRAHPWSWSHTAWARGSPAAPCLPWRSPPQTQRTAAHNDGAHRIPCSLDGVGCNAETHPDHRTSWRRADGSLFLPMMHRRLLAWAWLGFKSM